jgi:hypothetical protein
MERPEGPRRRGAPRERRMVAVLLWTARSMRRSSMCGDALLQSKRRAKRVRLSAQRLRLRCSRTARVHARGVAATPRSYLKLAARNFGSEGSQEFDKRTFIFFADRSETAARMNKNHTVVWCATIASWFWESYGSAHARSTVRPARRSRLRLLAAVAHRKQYTERIVWHAFVQPDEHGRQRCSNASPHPRCGRR